MMPERQLLFELDELVKEQVSIFGLKVEDPVDRILETRIVPVNLIHAGHQISFSIICSETPLDLVFKDQTFPLHVLEKFELEVGFSLLDVVLLVKKEFEEMQKQKIRAVSRDELDATLLGLGHLRDAELISRYEMVHDINTELYLEVKCRSLRFLNPRNTINANDVKASSYMLKLVFEDGNLNAPMQKKFGLQFPEIEDDGLTGTVQKIRDVSYDNIVSFVECVNEKVSDLLNEVLQNWSKREKLILSLFAVFNPLGLVLSLDAERMYEIFLSLGKDKLLSVRLQNTFPNCLPVLLLISSEKNEITGEDRIKKSPVRKGDVFHGDKELDSIIENLINYISNACFDS